MKKQHQTTICHEENREISEEFADGGERKVKRQTGLSPDCRLLYGVF